MRIQTAPPRSEIVTIRFREADHQLLKLLAFQQGETVSEMVRMAVRRFAQEVLVDLHPSCQSTRHQIREM